MRASNLGVISIALLTLSNGADNIGVYVPFFAIARSQIWLILTAYGALVAVWCFTAKRLGNHPLVLRSLDRWGHWVVTVVFIGLGFYILRSGEPSGLDIYFTSIRAGWTTTCASGL